MVFDMSLASMCCVLPSNEHNETLHDEGTCSPNALAIALDISMSRINSVTQFLTLIPLL
jgi:hypothetical protein